MKLTTFLAVANSLAASVQGVAISQEAHREALNILYDLRRTLPTSPDGYTPSNVDCSSNPPTVRLANAISQNETDWLQIRRNNTVQPMRDLLTRLNISNFDAGKYIDDRSNNASALPNIALAFSGGGWRALINGGGIIKAMDNRTAGTTEQGHIGGLLQSATYLAGLSGGNWLVGSIVVNNYTTIDALVESPTLWEFGNSVLKGPPEGGLQIFDTPKYWYNIVDDVKGKQDAGFDTSITDYWGRALSYQLINATDGGPAQTFASIALTEQFQNGDFPFPISVADARAPGQKIVSLNSSVFEFNPFEMGTWDPTTYGFMPTRSLGSKMNNGVLDSGSSCVVGFDNVGYVLGTSSSLFNSIIYEINGADTDIPSVVLDVITDLLADISDDDDDIADYEPNPFYGWNPTGNSYNHNATALTLVDGGEDNQNIPFDPLIQPVRNIDVIFANDNSADTTNNWPNGSSLVQTYERSLNPIANGTSFPSVPDVNTFINLGLNTRPTFFGCNTSNITANSDGSFPPLIVYLPNYPYVTYSNQPTVSLTTNNTYRDAMIANGYEVATVANGTRSGYANWGTCIACAILSRSLERTGTDVPQDCSDCFEQYCWDGTLNSTAPSGYDPQIEEDERETSAQSVKSGAVGMAEARMGGVVGLVIVLGVMLVV